MKRVVFSILLFTSSLFALNNWQEGLIWQNEFNDGIQVANYKKKPIFLFLDSRTCFYCPKLKAEVLSHPKFQEKIKKYFTPVYLDNSTDYDSDVANTGQVPARLSLSMTPAIYFMGPNEEMLSRRGKKHMIIYGMWNLEQMLEWMDDAIKKFEKLYGEKYDFKK